jgi:hypothetical protein
MAGGSVTSSGGNIIHTFNSSGYLTPLTYVGNSLRFRSSNSAYLNRTFGTPTNNKIWTYSAWVKLGALGTDTILLASVNGLNTGDTLYFTGNNLRFTNGSAGFDLISNAVYRDPSAWYHIVLSVDSTQATSTNRVKIYVNGSQITFGTATYPSQNYSFEMNSAVSHTIAVERTTRYSDYYISNTQFIDGQQLTPNSFGSFNLYGVWQPISYGGTYGTNGFYLPFSNKTSTTTLGYDTSGNSNNWTCNNISLTAGSTYDSMTDVPTLTSETAANYAVINPLNQSAGSFTTANGNLQFTATATNSSCAMTIIPTSGKYYAEAVFTTGASSYYSIVGVVRGNTYVQWYQSGGGVYYESQGGKRIDGTATSYGASWTTGEIIGIAVDLDGGTVTFYKNNTSQGAITLPSSTTGWTFSIGDSHAGGGSVGSINCGQQPFVYTPPSGFLALNTFNM